MKPLIAILGPTASGKTSVAVAMARLLHGEIISADSRQVYRRMDIGTGKDMGEYAEIPHHLIDICEPGEKYNLHRFLQDYDRVLDDIHKRDVRPILCGGSGLYLESAISGVRMADVDCNPSLRESLQGLSLDQLTERLEELKRHTGTAMHNKTDVDTARRAIRAIEIETYRLEHPDEFREPDRRKVAETVIIGLEIDRDSRRRRIEERLDRRLQEGMVDEVKALLDSVGYENMIYYGLEYKYVTQYAAGIIPFDVMRTQLLTAIHQFAKRQMTWFRGMERRGFHIHWFPYDMPAQEMASKLDLI